MFHLHHSGLWVGISSGREAAMRLTNREWEAVLTALCRALAGEPETDEEDQEAMDTAYNKIVRRLITLESRVAGASRRG